MIHGLAAAIAVLLRFAFLFGIYYLIKGVLLLSGRHEQRRLGEMGFRRRQGMPLLGGSPASCFCLLLSFKDDILYSGTCSLRAAGAGVCEESEK